MNIIYTVWQELDFEHLVCKFNPNSDGDIQAENWLRLCLKWQFVIGLFLPNLKYELVKVNDNYYKYRTETDAFTVIRFKPQGKWFADVVYKVDWAVHRRSCGDKKGYISPHLAAKQADQYEADGIKFLES